MNVVNSVVVGPLPFDVTVDPGGTRVYVANYGGASVSVVDAVSHDVIRRIEVENAPQGLAVHPVAPFLYVAHHTVTGVVSVVVPETGDVLTTIPVGSEPQAIVVDPSGERVFVAEQGDGSVSMISTATNTVTGSWRFGVEPRSMVVFPSSPIVWVACADGNIREIDYTDDEFLGLVQVGGINLQGMALSPSGRFLWLADDTSVTATPFTPFVRVIDTGTRQNVGTIVASKPRSVTIDSAGHRVYVSMPLASGSGVTEMVDTLTNTILGRVIVAELPWATAVAPRGDRVYVANMGSDRLSVIDTTT